MSFTSYSFILIFLPIAYLCFVLAHRLGGWQWAINCIALISLVFYGMFGLPLLMLLIASLIFNFATGNVLACLGNNPKIAKNVLLGGIAVNIGALGYLKYTNFFIDVANQVAGSSFAQHDILVPLGVSFFTFIQIGFLLDAYNGQLLKHDFSRYIVFAAFFPCVTAGPLVMQREMMAQMTDPTIKAFDVRRLTIGLTMFAMGLFKKVVLADSIEPFASATFDGAAAGLAMGTATAWIGSVCYTLQLYFDFSGYSDMAIGLGAIFGLKLPLNFDSPFKATNISDFWRRWHMTMTRFFTSYVFSGLAMNGMRTGMKWKLGAVGRFFLVAALPSVVTFMVAGVWHGSGWTYLVYGLMHGIAIAVYLGWREFSPVRLPAPAAQALTLLTVICGLVMFRSADLTTAFSILAQMFGISGVHSATAFVTIDHPQALSMIVLFGAVTLLLPNTQQILHLEWPVIDTKPETVEMDAGLVAWQPTIRSALISAGLFAIAITSIGSSSGFLYYKF